MAIPYKKSPYKDVTDKDYSVAKHVDKTSPPISHRFSYRSIGRGIGKLAHRAKTNFKELARLARRK